MFFGKTRKELKWAASAIRTHDILNHNQIKVFPLVSSGFIWLQFPYKNTST
jgi:hypothetical protein